MAPFRITMIEALPSLERSQRAKALRAADYNLTRTARGYRLLS